MRQLWLLLYLAMVTLGSAAAQTQAAPLKTNGDVWWKHAVIYEVYPRSFQDIERGRHGGHQGHHAATGLPAVSGNRRDLDHADVSLAAGGLRLRHLGLRGDRSRNTASMADFDNLMKAAKRQGIRVIMDM